ncbi:Ulp1 protease family, carboxy-terminal domain protein [Arachis hypogaea]|nr:Ulp1 protease family, carboxy-terminal domain protein [Arachis hypogaea]
MESTEKQGLHPPSHDSQQHSMPTKEPLSGVDNQIKAEFMTVRTDLVRRDETILAILHGQAKQIQAITDLLTEHNQVIGFLIDRIAHGDSNGKGNMVSHRPKNYEELKGCCAVRIPEARALSFLLYGPGCVPDAFFNPMFRRKLEFREEEDSDFGELRNIWQRGLGSPFTFYTHTHTPCIDIYFWPPPGMQFFGHELSVAAYVFAEDLEPSELLVQNDQCVGNREALWTLRPGEEVVDDVINLVVAISHSFSERLIPNGKHVLNASFLLVTANYIEPSFSLQIYAGLHKSQIYGAGGQPPKGTPFQLMIYVPLHSGRHWYLMIVDMWEEKLVYLDSLKLTSEREGRIIQMLDVARFIDHILADKSYYEKQNITPKKVSSFKVFEPLVSQWMILTHLWASYELEEVNDSTRMALAIDLVMGSHNPTVEEVAEKARRYWDRSNRASYKKGKRQGKKANSPTGPLSPSI